MSAPVVELVEAVVLFRLVSPVTSNVFAKLEAPVTSMVPPTFKF